MRPIHTNDFSLPPPTGMTSITGQKLEELKAIYHDLIGSIIHSSENRTLLFSHFGDFDQSKNDSTLRMIESMVLESGHKRQVMKRVCSMLIELLQNMSIHGARDRSGHMHAYLIISLGKNGYRLLSGNLVIAEDIELLSNRMSELDKLDEKELRKLYIEVLCNEEYSNKGGAGLGLITIAKRAEKKLEYSIQRLDEHFGYFQLAIDVDIEQ